MSKRNRASYIIAAIFAIVALLAVYGYRFANDLLLGGHFARLSPGTINILGIDTTKGYSVIVENRVAKLVMKDTTAFGPGKMSEQDTSGGEHLFIPIKDMLKGLAGDVGGLSYFVQRLNQIKDDDLPPEAPVWKFEDITKALEGDQELRKRLVNDLNVNLDGTPLAQVRVSAMENGIIVDTPVPLRIPDGDTQKTIVARVKRPYHPNFMDAVERSVSTHFATTPSQVAEQYLAEAELLKSGNLQKENVAARLKSFGKDVNKLGAIPQQVLDSILVVVNEHQITGASYTTESSSKGDTYTLEINLSDEGKRRMWQFTRDKVGDQLLVTVDGVAIAAPTVEHGIASGQVEVSHLQDQDLVRNAVNQANKRTESK